jgi:hypothetical protein
MSASALRVTYSGKQNPALDRALDALAVQFGYKVRARHYDWVIEQQHTCYGQITEHGTTRPPHDCRPSNDRSTELDTADTPDPC